MSERNISEQTYLHNQFHIDAFNYFEFKSEEQIPVFRLRVCGNRSPSCGNRSPKFVGNRSQASAMGKTKASTQSPDGSNGSPSKKQKLEPRPIPSAATLKKMAPGVGTKRDRPDVEEGVLHLYALPYCKNGNVYGPQFGTGELLAVHFLYNGYPSLLFNFLGGIKSCVTQRHEENENEPATMEAFNCLLYTSPSPRDQA